VSEPSRKKIDYDRLQGCLYSDAVGSLLGGVTGTVSNTSYSNNIPVIEITRVASRRVAFCFVGLLAAFAFLPRLAYFITTVPDPVLGGSGLAIMALLAGIGLKTIAEDSSNPTEKYLLAGISISIGLVSAEQSLFGAFLPSSSLTFFNNALSTGALTAIGLSTYFRFRPKKTRSLILPADMDQFPVLKQTVDEVCEAFSLGEQATFRLHLACEELFALLLQDSEASRRITFTFTAEEHLVLVEVRDRSSIEDVDELSARESTSHDELIAGRGLGLILLNKIAESVRHDRISGYNYIQFSIPFQG
ncbi:MAG: hypothetical protein K9J81_10410, partial [Desulfohalobiaceae bacterium]|nr:hypothetical protein [Desulfohalobiaceae bacterium]